MRLASWLLLVTSLPLVVLCGGACGGSPAEDLCDAACDCTSCADAQRDECVDQIERSRDAADEAGCGGEMDSYIECVTDDLDCSNPTIEGLCSEEYEEVVACAGGVGASAESASSPPSQPMGTTPLPRIRLPR
jgi:hypothetical protein